MRVEQIDRDAITGKAKLRIKPVNGDQVRYSYGRNSVSETSPILDYHEIMETDEMEVEFLCLDTNGEHQTGSAAQWTNEVTLKFAFLNQGDEVLLEIAVAPPTATVKYTTDGSHPTNGGVYDSPFAVVPQTIIQVIGTKGEHSSEVKTIKAPDQQGKIDIKKDQPLRWNKAFKNGSTADSYRFLNTIKKTRGEFVGIDLALKGQGWANLSFDPNLHYSAEQVENIMQFVQEQLNIDGQLLFNCRRTNFPSGQHFLDAVKELRIDFKPEEIEQ